MIVVCRSGVFDAAVPNLCAIEGTQMVVLFADDLRSEKALDIVKAITCVRSIGDTPCELVRMVRGVLQRRQSRGFLKAGRGRSVGLRSKSRQR